MRTAIAVAVTVVLVVLFDARVVAQVSDILLERFTLTDSDGVTLCQEHPPRTSTPEGNLTGTPCDTVRQTNGAAGVVFWIKDGGTGTNTTGWVNFAVAGTVVDTTGTPLDNQVAIFTDANTIEGDPGLRFVTPNLGVGTPSPAELIDVEDTSDGAGVGFPVVRISDAFDGTWTGDSVFAALDFFSADTSGDGAGVKAAIRAFSNNTTGSRVGLSFLTENDTADLTIKATLEPNGNLGIGTTTPGELLEVENDDTRTIAQISNSATDGDPEFCWALSGTKIFCMGVDDGDGDKWKLGTTAIGTATALTVDGGNVGIGTTTPVSLLDVRAPDGAAGIVTLATDELTVVPDDELGRINFQAPSESDGGDAILVAASIHAEAALTFSAGSNRTDIVLSVANTGVEEERIRLAGLGGRFSFLDSAQSQGVTTFPGNAIGSIAALSSTTGGMDIVGIADADATGLRLQGILGSSNPTDTIAAIVLSGTKQDLPAFQPVGDAETVLQIRNSSTDLITVLGDGNVGFGDTTPTQTIDLTGTFGLSDVLLLSSTAPTISAGFGAGAAISGNNGTVAFRVDVGITAGSVGTIGLPTATTGWNCFTENLTGNINNSGEQTVQLSSTTATAVIENQTSSSGAATSWSDNDTLSVICFAF